MTSKTKSFKRYCCVYGCVNKRKAGPGPLTFFHIPNDIARRQKWLSIIDREDLLGEHQKAKNNYVCAAHFDESAIITSTLKRLKSDAVPTKLLPLESQENFMVTSPLNINKIEETKHNIMKRDSRYCCACLSADRKLARIGDANDYTDLIINITNNSIKDPQQLELCWECLAELKRMQQFKSRIDTAQSVLEYQCEQEEEKIKSLSRLSVTYTGNIIFIIHEDENELFADEKKPLCPIKNETEFNISNITSDHDIDHLIDSNLELEDFECEPEEIVQTQEIKKEEVKSKTKEEFKSKTKKAKIKNTHVDYRFLYGPNNFQRSSLRKRFDIPPKDVTAWIEKEKSSSFFKALNFKCKLCYHGFNYSREKLIKHYAQRHDKSLGPHTCPTCSSRFRSQAQMLAHTQKHARAYACMRCGYQCYSLKGMNTHIDSHRLVQCAYCDMVLPTVGAFRVHQKSYHKEFICDYCKKTCRSKNMIQKHIIMYHLKRHNCSDCDRIFPSRPALLKHRFAKHTTCKPELAYCVLCDKQFKTKLLYRRHVATSGAHVSETHEKTNKKVKCLECSNSYARRSAMMNHYRYVHMKDSNYKCDHCNRQFLTSTRLQDHIRMKHEGVKPEKNKLCTVCGRGFSDKRVLQNHMRIHTGERPFECEYCDSKFAQKQALTSHVKHIHLKNKRKGS